MLRPYEDEFWFSLSDTDLMLWLQAVTLGRKWDVDIAEIERIERALGTRYAKRFRDRVFTSVEQEYCEGRGRGRAQPWGGLPRAPALY